MRIITVVLAVLLTASVVSFTGVIGFVGLVAPHMARFLIGNDHRYLMLFAGIIGALLLVTADTIGRTILSPPSSRLASWLPTSECPCLSTSSSPRSRTTS